MKKFMVLVVAFLLAGTALAQGEPMPGEDVIDQIMKALGGLAGASATVAVVLEFVFRLIPSKKPLSLLHGLAKILKVAEYWLLKLSEMAAKLGEILDKVLPQKIKK